LAENGRFKEVLSFEAKPDQELLHRGIMTAVKIVRSVENTLPLVEVL
jgi:hypothetical protein